MRRACRLVGLSRSTFAWKAVVSPDEESLRERIKGLAKDHRRYGYRRITALLRREGEQINIKRVHRIWKTEGLSLPQRRPRILHPEKTVLISYKYSQSEWY